MVVQDWQAVTGIIAACARRAGADGDGAFRLNEPEVYALLDAVGIARGPAELLPAGADEKARQRWARRARALAGERGQLVLKVVGREILHKSDVGGVEVLSLPPGGAEGRLLQRADGILATARERGAAGRIEGVLACGLVTHRANVPGQELLLALRLDPAFGPVVVVGVGGVLTEWYGQGTGGRSTLVFPAQGLTGAAVSAALRAHPLLSLLCTPSRLYPVPPLQPDRLAASVLALAGLGQVFAPDGETGWTLEEIEINPAVAADGRPVALDGVGLASRGRWPVADRPLEKIAPLLAPRSAVVTGVSARGRNPGRIILDNLRRARAVEPGRLYVVHHEEREISGVPCFPAVADLPEKVDLAVVAIPAEGAREAIAALVDGDRAESIILIPGGFAETGETGLAEAIEAKLQEGHRRPGGGPVMVGGNCLGIVSRERYNTFFLPPYKLAYRPGRGSNLAMISQSGAYLVTFASNYDGLIYPAASISFGNQMDLTVADLLHHFLGENEVNVVACYVEGFKPGDGARFLEFARRARAAGKRVIVFKAGKTELGARAAASHTASLAGDYAVARACLMHAGVTVAESLDEFEDLIKTFTLLAERPPVGRRAGILSNAGFECSTVMDRLAGLELAVLDDGTRAVLDGALPPFAHRDNPVDATPIADTEAYVRAAAALLECPEVDLAVISAVPVTPALDNLEPDPWGRHRENIWAAESMPGRLIPLLQASVKPAVLVIDSGRIYDPVCFMFERAGIPVFRKIDRAARALAAFCAG